MSLTEFLLARIAEDEDLAVAAGADAPAPWVNNGGTLEDADRGSLAGYPGENVTPHIARHDPARVLAEVEAKRRIVEFAMPNETDDPRTERGRILRILATVYSDHADYDEAWRV